MDYSSSSSSQLDSGRREEYIDQVKQQLAVAQAQELLQRMSDKCFKKCVTKPGSSLDNSEQKCIAMCMDRYMDTMNIVARTYSSRLQQEMSRMGS
ncbi:hypothetical protein FSP39_005472 [Pinctada imbricata]|uniref:Mitochondrial import inner membrane translocase subunit n=1 Tax=Pinctada imbricata TaxID=66713 RepID=A0AA88Y399_PINIB|nr:hypothetical protein FSP39_005472 [Pinctada imbricata]